MAGIYIRLMLVVICFSHLICMNRAIPVTRSSNLVVKPQTYDEVARKVLLKLNPDEKSWKEELRMMRRMGIEVNDYPGSGANNRHTPRPQLGRGCIDC